MTQSMITKDLGTLGPVDFDTLAMEIYQAAGAAETRFDDRVDSLHRANGERPQGGSGRSAYYRNTLAETLAQVEADPTRPLRGQIGKTAADALAAYREALERVGVLHTDEQELHAEYDSRPWPRYMATTGSDAHIHRDTRCSTCNRGGKRTEFRWLVELSGTPIEQAIKRFKVTMCTVCFPDAPVVAIVPDGCQGSTVEGSRQVDKSGGRYSITTVRYFGDCTCGAKGIRIKQDGSPAKHAPAVAPKFTEGARVTHPGDPGRVWIVRDVTTTGRVEKVKVEDESKPGANRVFLAVDCTAVPTVASALAEVEQAGETLELIRSAAAGAGVALSAQPEQQHAGHDDDWTPGDFGREIVDEPAPVEAPATLVPTFGPFDEIEHPSMPGVVLVVDHVTPAGRVVAHPDGNLDQSGRYLAVKCLLLRSADQVAAGKNVEDKTAELMAVARRADATRAKVDLDRLRALVLRYGLTVNGGGHVHDVTGYNVTQGMPDLAAMISRNRSLALRTVRAGEPVPGTWAALADEQVSQNDNPRVTLPSGLSGRVSIYRTVAATDRYAVQLLGFGVGDFEGSEAFVDAAGVVLDDVDRLLRGKVHFVRALERAQVEHKRAGKPDSPNSLGRDAWLTTIPVHLERGWGEGPVWCPEEAPARETRVRADATCPACEQAIAFDQLKRGAEGDQAEGRPVRDADGQVVDTTGLDVTVELRLFFAGRVRGECGHFMYASERRAGLRSCERCPGTADDVDDQDDEPARPVIARYSRQACTLAIGPEGTPSEDLQWIEAGGPWERDGALFRAGWARVGEWADDDLNGRGEVEVRPLEAGEALGGDGTVHQVDADIEQVAGEFNEAWAAGTAVVDKPVAVGAMHQVATMLEALPEGAEAAGVVRQIVGLVEQPARRSGGAGMAAIALIPHLATGAFVVRHDLGDEIARSAGTPVTPVACDRAEIVSTLATRRLDKVRCPDCLASEAYAAAVDDVATEAADDREAARTGGAFAKHYLGEREPAAGEPVDMGGGWVWRPDGKGGWTSSGDEGTDVGELRVSGDEIGGTTGGGKTDLRASIVTTVIETHRDALRQLLRLDGFVPGFAPGVPDFPTLVHPAGVVVSVDEGGTTVQYPDDNVGDGEYGEGVGWVRVAFGTTYGAIRDVAVGLVSVAGGVALASQPTRDKLIEVMDLVTRYGQAAAVGGDTARGVEAMAAAKAAAGERFIAVRDLLVDVLYPKSPAGRQHVTRIIERDSAGHWAWDCETCPEEATGYETADEVIEAATAHGPLAADSLRPIDDVEALIIPGEGGKVGGSIGKTGAQLEIDGERHPIPDKAPVGGVIASHRITAGLAAAGYRPSHPDGYMASLTERGIRVVEGAEVADDVDKCGRMFDHGPRSTGLLRANDGALYVGLSGQWSLVGYRPLPGIAAHDWREAQAVAALEISAIRHRAVTSWAHEHDQAGHVWIARVDQQRDDEDAVADVRRRVLEFLTERGQGGASYDRVAAHIGDVDVEQLGTTLRKVLTTMYADDDILSSHASDYLGATFYAAGLDCPDCESGTNCLAHRTFEQRIRASW